MKSPRQKYDIHINELVKGFLKTNKRKAKRMKLTPEKVKNLISQELTYQEYLMGRKIKKININGLEFERKTKFYDPSMFQDPLNIKTLN